VPSSDLGELGRDGGHFQSVREARDTQAQL
jgi:hypothetical protein